MSVLLLPICQGFGMVGINSHISREAHAACSFLSGLAEFFIFSCA
jgi:hypothetical protein